MKTNKRHILLAAGLLLGSILPATAADQTATWDNSTGNWSDPSKWSTNPNFANNGNGGFTFDAAQSGGTLIVNQAITIEKFNFTGGTLTGSQTLTLNDLMTFTGGDITGTGTLDANAGVTFSGTDLKRMNSSRVVNLNSNSTWTGGEIRMGDTSTLTNTAGNVFTTNFDGTIGDLSGLTTVNNAGTFTKSAGGGTTTIAPDLNNTGAVNVNSGTLSANGGGTSTGTWNVASGTTLNFGGGSTQNLNAGTNVSAAGTVGFNNGTTNFNAGTYNVTGTTQVNGGTANFNATANTNLLNVSSGTLGGSGTLSASGLTSFTGGTMRGSGTLNANGGVSFSTGTLKTLDDSRVLNLGGSSTWTGGEIRFAVTSTLNNTVGGVFTTDFDGTMGDLSGLTTFNNAGTFTKSGGTGSTTIGVIFTNSGTVNVNSGTLSTGNSGSKPYTQSGPSSFTIISGGAMIDTSSFNLNGGTLKGNGTVDGPLSATTANATTIAPGMSPGTLTINGSTVLGTHNTLAMELGGLLQGAEYDYLDVNGVLTLGGLLDVDFINGFETNLPNGQWLTLATANSAILGSFSNVASGGYVLTDLAIPLQVYYGAGSPYGEENLVIGIPEPSRVLLLLSGLAGAGLRRRRTLREAVAG